MLRTSTALRLAASQDEADLALLSSTGVTQSLTVARGSIMIAGFIAPAHARNYMSAPALRSAYQHVCAADVQQLDVFILWRPVSEAYSS